MRPAVPPFAVWPPPQNARPLQSSPQHATPSSGSIHNPPGQSRLGSCSPRCGSAADAGTRSPILGDDAAAPWLAQACTTRGTVTAATQRWSTTALHSTSASPPVPHPGTNPARLDDVERAIRDLRMDVNRHRQDTERQVVQLTESVRDLQAYTRQLSEDLSGEFDSLRCEVAIGEKLSVADSNSTAPSASDKASIVASTRIAARRAGATAALEVNGELCEMVKTALAELERLARLACNGLEASHASSKTAGADVVLDSRRSSLKGIGLAAADMVEKLRVSAKDRAAEATLAADACELAISGLDATKLSQQALAAVGEADGSISPLSGLAGRRSRSSTNEPAEITVAQHRRVSRGRIPVPDFEYPIRRRISDTSSISSSSTTPPAQGSHPQQMVVSQQHGRRIQKDSSKTDNFVHWLPSPLPSPSPCYQQVALASPRQPVKQVQGANGSPRLHEQALQQPQQLHAPWLTHCGVAQFAPPCVRPGMLVAGASSVPVPNGLNVSPRQIGWPNSWAVSLFGVQGDT